MDLKKTLTTQGLKLMSDPRVLKLMQDERFMKLMMAAISMPGKVQGFADTQKDVLAESLGLATRQEVDELRGAVRSLEEQVSALQELLSTVLGATQSSDHEPELPRRPHPAPHRAERGSGGGLCGPAVSDDGGGRSRGRGRRGRGRRGCSRRRGRCGSRSRHRTRSLRGRRG